jgi:hypothetical protein
VVTPWKLPLLVAAIAIPVVAGFYVGGPGVGVAMGALMAAVIVALAVRQRPRGPLGEAPSEADRRRLLVVLVRPVGDPEALGRIVEQAIDGDAAEGGTEVMVLAPARIGFLDRWASDVEGSRREAQRDLVHAVAALTKAGISAEARVGDEDLVQAVEDQIGSFPATEVVLVSAAGEGERSTASAAAELESRLRPRFRWLRVSGPAAD